MTTPRVRAATGRTHRRGRASVATAAALAGLVVVVAGCSGIPGSGAAVDVTRVADQAAPAAPLEPQAGQQPDQIVRGFVAATAQTDLDAAAGSPFGAARQFLTAEAQAAWQPSPLPVVVLADVYRTEVNPADPDVVTVTGRSVGTLDSDRTYHARDADVRRPMQLAQVDGEWRIAEPPAELLLTASEFDTAFRQRILYFLDPGGTVVVPDIRHVVIGQSPANRASRLISLLIKGPTPTLAGAARTQFTAESALRSNPSIDSDGVLQVDLTGVEVSTPEDARALAAQLVWTLSTTSPRIAITVDGEALDPAQPIWTINAVSSFDPDRLAGTGEVESDPYYINAEGGIVGLTSGQPIPGPLGVGDPRRVETAALSSASGALAVVEAAPEGDRDVLLIAQPRLSELAEPVLEAAALTQPTFTRAGDEAWIVQNGADRPEVYRVSTTGGASRERVAAPTLSELGDGVTALALSPDGVRAAVVMDRRLYLGVIAPEPADGAPPGSTPGEEAGEPGGSPAAGEESATVQPRLMLTNFVEVRPDLSDVAAVAFVDSRRLMVAASPSENIYRTVWEVAIDGYEARGVTSRGLFGDVDWVAVATGEPMLVAFSGRVWQLDGTLTDGQWVSPLEDQPFLTGRAPFYPS